MRLPICGVVVAIAVVMFVASPHAARQSKQPRYYFTTEPLEIKEFRQCVAVEPANPTGVWVYSPGQRGCGSRTSGPDLYHPDGATVVSADPAVTVVRFRLQRRFPPPPTATFGGVWVDAELTVRDGYMSTDGSRVRVEGRNERYIPGDDVLL